MVYISQLIWNGIVLGSAFAVAALGLTIIYGVLNFINVAYSEYLAFGGYFVFAMAVQYELPFILAVIIAVPLVSLLALLTDQVAFKKFRDRPPVLLLVVSMGMSFILRNIIRIIWGGQPQIIFSSGSGPTTLAGVNIFPSQAAIIVLSLVIMFVSFFLLKRTRIGMAMRAASDDLSLTKVRGINTERLVVYVWLFAGSIAAFGGITYGINAVIRPLMGLDLLLILFAAMVIGGIGDSFGAIVGGYIVGIIQEVSIVIVPAEFKTVVAMSLLLVVLLVKPEGIFGSKKRV